MLTNYLYLAISACIGLLAVILSDSDYSPLPKKWVAKKPFGCYICLTFWGCLLTAPFFALHFIALHFLIAYLSAFYFWRQINR